MAPVDSFPKKENWQSKFTKWMAGFLYTGGIEYAAEEAGAEASEAAISSMSAPTSMPSSIAEVEPEAIELSTLIPRSASGEVTEFSSYVNPAYEPDIDVHFDEPFEEDFDLEMEDPFLNENAPLTSTPQNPEVSQRNFARNPRRAQTQRRFELGDEVEVKPQRGRRGLIAKRIKKGWRSLRRGRKVGRNEEEFFELSSINPEEEGGLFDQETNLDEELGDDDEIVTNSEPQSAAQSSTATSRTTGRSTRSSRSTRKRKLKFKSDKKVVTAGPQGEEPQSGRRTRSNTSSSKRLRPARGRPINVFFDDSDLFRKGKRKRKCKTVKGKKRCKRTL